MAEQNISDKIMSNQNKKVRMDPDDYIDMAIKNVYAADAKVVEPGTTINQCLAAKIIMVDTLENTCKGLDLIKTKSSDGKKTAYVENVDNFKASDEYAKENDEMLRKNKLANFKFMMILNAVKKSRPVETEFEV